MHRLDNAHFRTETLVLLDGACNHVPRMDEGEARERQRQITVNGSLCCKKISY